MTAIQAIVMAVLQGVTELFPISSLGHAVILPRLLNWNVDLRAPDWLAYLTVMHLGTAIALFTYFWRDWFNFAFSLLGLSGDRSAADRRVFWLVVLATIPAVVIGAGLHKLLAEAFGSPVDRVGLPDRQRLPAVLWRPGRRRDGRQARPAQLEGRAGGRLRPVPGPHSRHLPVRLDHRRRRDRRPEARGRGPLLVPDGHADHSRRQCLRGAEAVEGGRDAGADGDPVRASSPA